MDFFKIVKAAIDIPKFYQEFIPDFNGVDQSPVACIFHDDNSPSLSIDPATGLFKCHAGSCGEKGDLFHFYSKVKGITVKDALHELAEKYNVKLPKKLVISKEKIEEWIKALHDNEELFNWFSEFRKISKKTLENASIGWDGQRYTIPIYEDDGLCHNVRRYSNASNAKAKMINYIDEDKNSYGKNRLYPFFAFDNNPIIICEGEFDCISARDRGINAITATGGASNWDINFNKKFKGKDVIICYDNDIAGDVGAKLVAENIKKFAKSIKIAKIPIDKKGADITDFFRLGKSSEDFQTLVLDLAVDYLREEEKVIAEDKSVLHISLQSVSQAEYTGKMISFNARVSGHDPEPFIVPNKVICSCNQSQKFCSSCPMGDKEGSFEVSIESDGDMIKLCNIPSDIQNHVLKKIIGIPIKCPVAQFEATSHVNIQELMLVPETEGIDLSSEDTQEGKYTLQTVFHQYNQGENTESNRAYYLEGMATVNPKNQKATVLIYKALSKHDSIEKFFLNDERKQLISKLQPKEWNVQTLEKKFDEIAFDLEHVTRIIDRNDLLKAILLTYFSPLYFDFKGEIKKGWLDCLIIGDTRTGKSSSVTALRRHFRCGDMGSGESSSYAGLVGGLQQVNGRWVLNWGGIPLADRRLFIIDEASGLAPEYISKMSDLRSSGLAEIKKVRTESTFARTRLIWLSNPRSNRSLSSYPFGVVAIKELIGKQEDISRFDFAVGVGINDISSDKINNKIFDENYELTYTSELFYNAILNAWSLKHDKIIFSDEALKIIISKAIEQGNTYSPDCPLVNSSEQRIKIARVAVACAVMFCSTEDFITYNVLPCHVQFAVNFLESCYNSDALHYDIFSRSKMLQDRLKDIDKLDKNIDSESAKHLLDFHEFTRDDIDVIFSVPDRRTSNEILKILKSSNSIKKGERNLYHLTRPMIEWLRGKASEITTIKTYRSEDLKF